MYFVLGFGWAFALGKPDLANMFKAALNGGEEKQEFEVWYFACQMFVAFFLLHMLTVTGAVRMRT